MSRAAQVIHKVQRALGEAIDNNDDMVVAINKAVSKHFPKSFVSVAPIGILGGKDPLLKFAFGKDKSEWPNGIDLNDPLRINISFQGFSDETGMLNDKGKVKAEMTMGGAFRVNGQPLMKFPWRNTAAKPDAIVKKVDKYFGDIKKWLSTPDGKEALKQYKERL